MSDSTPLTDAELVDRFAHVKVDRDSAAFYRGLLSHELRMHRCADCGWWHHPPRPMCPRCWSWNVVPTAVSGRGRVHLRMGLHQGPGAPGVDYRSGAHPVVTVALAEQEGLRFTSTVVNCDPAALRIDMPVKLTWIERAGNPFPVFEPAED